MVLTRNPPPSQPAPAFEKRVSLGHVRLYLTDLDAVLHFLRSRCDHVTLSLGPTLADDANDLKEARRDELALVAISTSGPELTVWLHSARAEVATRSHSASGLADDVVTLLAPLRVAARGARAWLGLLAIGVGILLFVLSVQMGGPSSWAGLLGIAGVVIPFVGAIVLLNLIGGYGSSTRIYLATRSDRRVRTFTLWTTISGTVLGAAIGAAATLIATSLG